MMTSWSLAKYRLCMQSRRMSFQTRSVGVNSGQEVQHEAEGLLLTPKLMQMGVMVSDVIDDDHNAVAASHTDAPQITKKVKEGGGLELVPFLAKHEPAVPQSHAHHAVETALHRWPTAPPIARASALGGFLCNRCNFGLACAIAGRGLRKRKPNW
jgi:hypothetical protein